MPSSQKVYNLNNLSPVGFSFQIQRCPNVNWFVQEAIVPGINLGDASKYYATGKAAIPGDNLEYDELSITFIVDESLNDWREIYNWMRGLAPTAINGGNQYESLKNSDFSTTSDGTLIILTNSSNPNISMSFKDLFPVSLSHIQFRTTDTALDPITATVSFRYTYFDFDIVNPEYNEVTVPTIKL